MFRISRSHCRQASAASERLIFLTPPDFAVKRAARSKILSPVIIFPKIFPLKECRGRICFLLPRHWKLLRDAGLYPLPEELKEEMGVAIGGGAGGLLEAEEFLRDLLKKNGKNAKFSKLSSLFCASSADRIASTFGFTGPKSTFMTACSGGATAHGLRAGFDSRTARPPSCLPAAWNPCAGLLMPPLTR